MNDDSNIQKAIDRIVRLQGSGNGSVIPLLQEIQREYRYLPGEAMRLLSKSTGIPVAQLEGVASFYGQFRFEPAGRHIVHVCTGTACHVKGALVVYDAFARALKLTDGLLTDAAGLFTLEKVACLGCCTLAPVVKIDQVTYGHVKPGDAEAILNDFLARKTAPDGKMHKADGSAPMQGEIRVGLGSCCVASGSTGVKEAIDEVLEETGIRVGVRQVGCVGVCNQVPMIEIVKNGEPGIFYTRLKPNEVRDILLTHFKPAGLFGRVRTSLRRLLGRVVEAPAPATFERYDEEQRDNPLCDFLDPQLAIATEHRGKLSPLNIAEYRSGGGFAALERCLAGFQPGEIIEEIVRSGLRGRGGAGFPTGEKWQLARRQESDQKYVICNGDEGDPGAFMDRMLLESYPFRIIEGMLIAGFATGASEGLFYIRAEYPLAVARVKEALEICRTEGMLGERILNSGFRFSIRVFEGAGAFVCGEETALIASVEGYRGTPRLRPPYPVVSGLNGKPTLVNNAETLSLIPWIIRNGAGKFAAIGTPGSKGTKVFALAGKVRRGGLIEVPMGITIRMVVEEIGGGMQGEGVLKAVQIGGPSGGCIPASMADMPVDFEALAEAGGMMGSGGMVVLDDRDCMVDLARYFLSFTQAQSCGQCTFCRIGTRRMLETLEKICNGQGTSADLDHLEQLARSVQAGSLCGLGKTAPNPVLTTLRHFRDEYQAHIEGRCPAGRCTPLIRYEITEQCIGCTLCAQRCPTGAIAFQPYEIHRVDPEKCIKCDICRQVCPAGSVIIT